MSCAQPIVCVVAQTYVCVKLSPLSMSFSVNRLLLKLIRERGSSVREHGVGKQLTDTERIPNSLKDSLLPLL